MRRLVAVGFIWLGCTLAWMALGSTVMVRGGETSSSLESEVRLLWGPAIVQQPPSGELRSPPPAKVTPPSDPPAQDDAPPAETASDVADGSEPPVESPAAERSTPPDSALVESAPPSLASLALVGSDIDVSLDLEQRKKGLLWFPTYAISFRGSYRFQAPRDLEGEATLRFPLAGATLVYDAFKVSDGAGEVVDASIENGYAVWHPTFTAGETKTFVVDYRSRGTDSFQYGAVGQTAAKIRDFRLAMTVNTPAIDFPAGTLSPSSHQSEGEGWRGEWVFDSLVSSAPIGVDLPRRLNPGPLVSRVTFFAPVSLLFFFFVTAILAAARRKRLHPMHFFLLGCGFFAFHLLFAYSVDHFEVLPAFVASAIVSLALVISYARHFVGWRFALVEMGGAQLVYLVLFSYTFFWQGVTGLAVTLGAILTLFVIMQITGRLDWSEAFADLSTKPAPPPVREDVRADRATDR